MIETTVSILVVDDDPDIRFAVVRLLRNAGYPVAEAENGETALRLIRETRPDLVLLDVMLPDIDGHEICRTIKTDEELKNTYVILLSGKKTGSDDQSEGLEIGADGYVARPVSNRELLARIQSMVRIIRAEARLKQIEWMLSPKAAADDAGRSQDHDQGYGDLTELNHDGIILKSIGRERLESFADDYLDLLGTSSAIYEVNGDYAFGIFSSGWCRMMDGASRRLCDTADNVEALNSGRWLCHESCWTHCSREAIVKRAPVDIACNGGLRIFAVPIFAGENVVGAINFGYGDPPKNPKTLQKLADVYHINYNDLVREAHAYNSRPPYIIEMAKKRLHATARLIGAMIKTKQAEEALESNYALLKIAGEKAHFGGWTVDLGANICTWSDAVADIHEVPHGYAPPVEEGINFYAPEWHEKITQVFSACAKEGISYDEDMEIITQKGKRVWVRTIGKAVKDENGRIIKVHGSFQDITERKEAENALRKSESKYKLLADNTIDCIWVLNMDLVFTYINPAIELMMGYTPDEWIGTRLSDHCTHERFEHIGQLVMEAIVKLPDVSPIFFETEMLSKDGRSVPLEILSRTITDAGGNPIAFQGVTRDITERKKAEAEREKLREQLLQSQKMESVGRLAGGVAHDYNNMLSVILGYSEMALEQVDPADPLHADLKEIYNAGKRSMEITQQLLGFARKQTIAPKVLDLNEAVEGMLKMLRRLIGEDIHLEWHPEAMLWPVKMDPAQLNQVLANLCVNARDAIDDVGKITIETENITFDAEYCENHAGFVPGEFVMLAVSDNGCGMDKETRANLFEPFFTTKGVGKGTGLGLATVYGIVKQNNGFINVYSEPGQGTTFHIYVPRHAAEETHAAVAEIPAEIVPGKGETVLLVEDEPNIIKMGKIMLEKLNYQVLTAETPGRAMDLAREHAGKIDLLMTDVVMPEMNGRDLAEKLQALNPDLNVLFMSGYTANVIAHHGVLDAGVHFIQKPFSIRDLAAKIRAALE